MLAVRMRGQSRSPFNSSLSKEKRRTHAAQYTRFVEPDPAMSIILLGLASFGFVYQRERAITCSLREPEVKVDHRRAAVKSLGRNCRDALDDRAAVFANYASRVAAADELQLFCPSLPRDRYDPRHPVLLMPPFCAQQTLLGQPDRTRTLVVQARQNLRGLSVLGRRSHLRAAPEPAAPREKLRILEPRLRRPRWRHDLRQGLHRGVTGKLQ